VDMYAYMCVLAAAFTLAFSLPAGRTFMALALVLLIVRFFKTRKPLVMPATGWAALAFIAVAIASTAFGESPALGFRKIDKLVWFMAIPVTATVITSYRHLSGMMAAYVFGCGVLSVMTLIQAPIRAVAAFVTDRTMNFGEAVGVLWNMPHGQIQASIELARAGKTTDFVQCLIATGSMTDAQRLMAGITVALGLVFICRADGRPTTKWWVFVILQCAAILLNFKRGSWICAFAMVTAFVAMRTTWRHTLTFFALVIFIVLLPPVRDRLTDLRLELKPERGGRLLMWTKIGPALAKEHPWLGIGYRCLTNEMMKKIDRAVEANRNHLHSNVLQVLVETGLIGLAVYLVWMVLALWDAIRFVRRTRAGPAVEGIMALSVLLVLVALIANGVVEYNFSDSEVVLVYGLVIGAAAAGCRRLAPREQSRGVTG